MAPRSDVLVTFSGDLEPTVVHDFAAVPAGEVWIVKELLVTNILSVARDVYLSIKRGGQYYVVRIITFGAGYHAERLDHWTVLEAGDQLGMFASVVGGTSLYASGARLTVA